MRKVNAWQRKKRSGFFLGKGSGYFNSLGFAATLSDCHYCLIFLLLFEPIFRIQIKLLLRRTLALHSRGDYERLENDDI
jgi:hypothetical protein